MHGRNGLSSSRNPFPALQHRQSRCESNRKLQRSYLLLLYCNHVLRIGITLRPVFYRTQYTYTADVVKEGVGFGPARDQRCLRHVPCGEYQHRGLLVSMRLSSLQHVQLLAVDINFKAHPPMGFLQSPTSCRASTNLNVVSILLQHRQLRRGVLLSPRLPDALRVPDLRPPVRVRPFSTLLISRVASASPQRVQKAYTFPAGPTF